MKSNGEATACAPSRGREESMTSSLRSSSSPVGIVSSPPVFSIPCHDRDNLVLLVICGHQADEQFCVSPSVATISEEGSSVTIIVVNVSRRFSRLTNRDASPDTRSFCRYQLLSTRAPYAWNMIFQLYHLTSGLLLWTNF